MGKWEMVPFDIAISDETKNGTKIMKENYLQNGRYPIIDQGKELIAGYSNKKDGIYENIPAIIFGDHTRVIKYIDMPFFLGADGVKLLKSKISEIDYKYLYYYLTTERIPNTGYNRHFKWLKEVCIPLPPLEVQRQIADVLDRASALIEKRKAQIENLDLLVKSQFIEMFGNFIITHNQWPFSLLGEHAEVVSGVTKGRKLTDGVVEVPYLRVANVKDGYLDLSEIKTIPATKTEREKYQLKQYDILMTEGGDPDKLGRGAIWSEEIYPCIHQNHIFRVRLEQSIINPVYFTWYLRQPYAKQYFLKSAKQTTGIASINMTQLTRLPVFIPPFSLQTQFADFVQQIEAQKSLLHQSLLKLELNYKSLMQKCFKGEVF